MTLLLTLPSPGQGGGERTAGSGRGGAWHPHAAGGDTAADPPELTKSAGCHSAECLHRHPLLFLGLAARGGGDDVDGASRPVDEAFG